MARITPVNGSGAGKCPDGTAWNDLKNVRRCELVDREIEGTLLLDEAAELAVLQQQMLTERRRLAPVPLDDLRRLHQELLAKAARGRRQPMSAFRYPAVPHARRHGPRGYADAESYRPWLRDEFTFRCVYCLFREQWGRSRQRRTGGQRTGQR